MTYEELRQEFINPYFRDNLKNTVGSICVNCGTDENIEYHHIVPLKNGGSNNLSNIVPLCQRCHKLAHNKILRNTYKSGRPKAIKLEDAEHVLHRYFNLEIGKKESVELLGINPKSKDVWRNLTKEYKIKYNIDKFYNNIDLLNAQEQRVKTIKNNRLL